MRFIDFKTIVDKKNVLTFLHLFALCWLHAQSYGVHSHNDYYQSVPFWKAYAAGVSSIEVDVHLKGSVLLVAHDYDELTTHANEIDRLFEESLAFDRAVAEAVQFADAEKNTLVLITADHETGGLTISQGNRETHTIV